MSKYIDLEEQIVDDSRAHRQSMFSNDTRVVLRWLDDNPDEAPGRTITRSEMRERMNESFETQVREIDVEVYTESLGRIVTPDPEPTNAEKLEAHLLDLLGVVEAIGNTGVHNMAYELDRAGVKAPGDAGE